MNNQPIIAAGIDVSKRRLDLAIASDKPHRHQRYDYDPTGIEQLVHHLKAQHVDLVVFEATGGLEWPLMQALEDAGLNWHRANPRQIRDYAKAMNKLAKTDQIDAGVIADFARTIKPSKHTLPRENQRQLKAAITRYEQLVHMRTAEKNRLQRTSDSIMCKSIETMLQFIEKQIEAVEQHIDQLVEADQHVQQQVQRLATVPGIGQLTAQRLAVMLPELGDCNRRQIARLIGVAPINRDSGTLRGKRTTGGGRASVRHALYMPTVVCLRRNPVIKAHYQHLLTQGKTKMVALVACMRKLIILINTMTKEKISWQQLINQT